MHIKQKAALKNALHRPRQFPIHEVSTTPRSLLSGLAIFACGVFFGWLFAGCPSIAAMF